MNAITLRLSTPAHLLQINNTSLLDTSFLAAKKLLKDTCLQSAATQTPVSITLRTGPLPTDSWPHDDIFQMRVSFSASSSHDHGENIKM